MTPHLRLLLLMSRATDTALAIAEQQVVASGAPAAAVGEFVPAVQALRDEISRTAREVVLMYEMQSRVPVRLPEVPEVPDHAERG